MILRGGVSSLRSARSSVLVTSHPFSKGMDKMKEGAREMWGGAKEAGKEFKDKVTGTAEQAVDSTKGLHQCNSLSSWQEKRTCNTSLNARRLVKYFVHAHQETAKESYEGTKSRASETAEAAREAAQAAALKAEEARESATKWAADVGQEGVDK
eukprot:1152849-Pelagomonas_calceolata.AAC.4